MIPEKSKAVLVDDGLNAFAFGDTRSVVQEFTLTLLIELTDTDARIKTCLGLLRSCTVFLFGACDSFLFRLALGRFGIFRLFAFFLQALVYAGHGAAGGGRGRRGHRCAYPTHAAARAFEDVLVRHISRRWPVAENLAAILVQPLPLGAGRQCIETGSQDDQGADHVHACSVAPGGGFFP